MYAVVIVIAAAAVVAIVLAAAGGPIVLAVLPLAIGAGVLAFLQVYKRREAGDKMANLRQQADSDTTDFTTRDQETQV